MKAKNAGSLSSATLIASLIPPSHSRWGRPRRKAKSSITANGGANVPRKFFLPNLLTLFLTPTPESFCDGTVVGIRIRRTPRWAVAAANPAMSSTAPPPMTMTKLCRSIPPSLIARWMASTVAWSFLTDSPPVTTIGGRTSWSVSAWRSHQATTSAVRLGKASAMP